MAVPAKTQLNEAQQKQLLEIETKVGMNSMNQCILQFFFAGLGGQTQNLPSMKGLVHRKEWEYYSTTYKEMFEGNDEKEMKKSFYIRKKKGFELLKKAIPVLLENFPEYETALDHYSLKPFQVSAGGYQAMYEFELGLNDIRDQYGITTTSIKETWKSVAISLYDALFTFGADNELATSELESLVRNTFVTKTLPQIDRIIDNIFDTDKFGVGIELPKKPELGKSVDVTLNKDEDKTRVNGTAVVA